MKRQPAAGKPTARSESAVTPRPQKTDAPASGATSASAKVPLPDRASLIRSHAGTSPEEQIARRNQASRADAVALASKRFDAASRALASLSTELDRERIRSTAHEDQLSTLPKAEPDPAHQKQAPAPPPPAQPPERPATAAKVRETAAKRPTSRQPDAAATSSPLLELKPSALTSDLSHAGDRLAIFNDRVELRDRNLKIRQRITGEEITDVVIQKRLAGVILSIESVDQPAIIAKGLTIQQAEEARALIMKKTRRAGSAEKPSTSTGRTEARAPQGEKPAPPVSPSEPASKSPAVDPDESDLLRKLTDLHRAGVLTDDELEDKVRVVRELVHGEELAPTRT